MSEVLHMGGDFQVLEVPMTDQQREAGWSRSGVLVRVRRQGELLLVHGGDWEYLTPEQRALVGTEVTE